MGLNANPPGVMVDYGMIQGRVLTSWDQYLMAMKTMLLALGTHCGTSSLKEDLTHIGSLLYVQ